MGAAYGMNTENKGKKDCLREYERAVHRMERSRLRIKEIRLGRMVPAVMNDGMPHARNNNDLSSYAVLLEREEKRYAKAKKECGEAYELLVGEIERLKDEKEKDVLTYRYIRLMGWNDICDAMGCSLQHIYRIHAKALENFMMRVNESK